MRVLITGASGFIGFPLSNKLSELGFKVLAIGRSIPVNSHKSISWIKSDLNSVEIYKDDITAFKPEVLIHLAWQDIPDFSFEKSFFNLNQSIKFISFIAEIKSCRKIIISGSCWEYGKDQGECKDSDKSIPTNYFTLAKHSLRLWTEIIAKEKSITLGWFRLFYVYGPGQRPESLIPTLFQYLRNEKLPEIKTPHNANDFIYIDDVVDAFSIAANSPFKSGNYNLGAGKSISALEICRQAEQLVLNSSVLTKKIELTSKSINSNTNFWASISSSKEQLKWSPKVSIFEGIQKSWKQFK